MLNKGEWNIKSRSGKCIDTGILSNYMGVKSMIKSSRDSLKYGARQDIMLLASVSVSVPFAPKTHCDDACRPRRMLHMEWFCAATEGHEVWGTCYCTAKDKQACSLSQKKNHLSSLLAANRTLTKVQRRVVRAVHCCQEHAGALKVMTKCHRLSGLNNRNLSSHDSGG